MKPNPHRGQIRHTSSTSNSASTPDERDRGGRGEADAYLRDGRCLSLEALEIGSLRSDFTSVASVFCPRAAAISYSSSPSGVGRWRRVVF
jgi:hypothetical protein